MQVFRAYFKILKRKLSAVIVYLVIFVALAVGLTTMGKKNETADYAQTSLDFGVENLDEGRLGNALVEYLDEYNEVHAAPETEDETLDAIFCRKYDYILYIPTDFTERFLAGKREELLKNRKVPSSAHGAFADRQIESYLQTLGMYLDAGFSEEESLAKTQENLSVVAEVKLTDEENAKEKDTILYYFDYLAYILIATVIIMVGPILMAFQRKEIDARNKCSAQSFFSRNIQLVAASIAVMLVEYALLMVVAFIIRPEYMGSVRGVLEMVNAFMMTLISMSLAYLSVQLVKREEALSAVSNVFALGFAFLGGVFVPLEIFSNAMMTASRFTPTYWYVTATEAINKVGSFAEITTDIWQSFAMEGIFAAALLAFGMMLNRMKARS